MSNGLFHNSSTPKDRVIVRQNLPNLFGTTVTVNFMCILYQQSGGSIYAVMYVRVTRSHQTAGF